MTPRDALPAAPGGTAASGTLRREMGITHAELFRLLPRAVGAQRYTVTGQRITIALEPGTVDFELGAERVRRIARLALPVTPVTITWDGVEEPRLRAFLERFDRTYQRGGG